MKKILFVISSEARNLIPPEADPSSGGKARSLVASLLEMTMGSEK